jgi:hypothetical protein
MTDVLPLLHLHGLSTSDFGPALEQFLGSGAGLSATTITRLTAQWHDEAKSDRPRPLNAILRSACRGRPVARYLSLLMPRPALRP